MSAPPSPVASGFEYIASPPRACRYGYNDSPPLMIMRRPSYNSPTLTLPCQIQLKVLTYLYSYIMGMFASNSSNLLGYDRKHRRSATQKSLPIYYMLVSAFVVAVG